MILSFDFCVKKKKKRKSESEHSLKALRQSLIPALLLCLCIFLLYLPAYKNCLFPPWVWNKTPPTRLPNLHVQCRVANVSFYWVDFKSSQIHTYPLSPPSSQTKIGTSSAFSPQPFSIFSSLNNMHAFFSVL